MAKLKRLSGKAAEAALFPASRRETVALVSKLTSEFIASGGKVMACPPRYAYGIYQQQKG